MLKNLIYKYLSGPRGITLWIAIIIFILFILIVLPREADRSQQYFGSTSAPDTSFIYSGEDLYNIAGDFGAEGRAYYIRSRFTFDILWPMAYGFFLWATLGYFFRDKKKSKTSYFLFLPIFAVVLDFFENSGASLVMYLYPESFSPLLSVVPVFTFLKWITIGASFLLLVFLFFHRTVWFLKKRYTNSHK